MKPTLAYKPQDYAYRGILLRFQDGEPLSCDELNFLYRYEQLLSQYHPELDAVCRYYLKQYKQQPVVSSPNSPKPAALLHPTFQFALPSVHWEQSDITLFQKKLEQLFKKGDVAQLEMVLTPEEFNRLRTLTLDKMIYLHGYRLRMHESFFPGWFPYSVYFAWADIFGVATYDLNADHGLTKTLITLHLEPQCDRPLEECVQQYLIKNHLSFKPTNQPPHHPTPTLNTENQRNQFTPQLTLSRSKEKKEDE